MERKTWMVLGLTVLILAIYSAAPDVVLAYGEDIETAGTRVYTWLRGIGGIAMTIGIGWTGILMLFMHDKRALEKTWWVIAGGFVTFMAPSIVNLIKGLAGSSGN